MNETSLRLEWSPPQEGGGREDVVYNIICKSCGSGRGGCTRCGDNVQFVPRQLGLTDTSVHISDLLAHTQYTFEIQAVNGVSDQSPYSPQYASVNITTNQAGEANTIFYMAYLHLLMVQSNLLHDQGEVYLFELVSHSFSVFYSHKLHFLFFFVLSTISSVHHPPGQQNPQQHYPVLVPA